jgi:hypothetical protein
MGTGYKLSLGQFGDRGSLSFRQNIVNPHTYNVIVMTEEPANDLDLNPADPGRRSGASRSIWAISPPLFLFLHLAHFRRHFYLGAAAPVFQLFL